MNLAEMQIIAGMVADMMGNNSGGVSATADIVDDNTIIKARTIDDLRSRFLMAEGSLQPCSIYKTWGTYTSITFAELLERAKAATENNYTFAIKSGNDVRIPIKYSDKSIDFVDVYDECTIFISVMDGIVRFTGIGIVD